MIKEILTFLVCPKSGQNLLLKDEITKDGRIQSGNLVSEDGKIKYEIVNFIPRFVEKSNYADNFGMQWNKFRKTQLDSFSKVPISEDRFWKSTGWKKESLKGNIILDAGCGSGRFSEIALKSGATIIAIDYSNAVAAAHKNLGENKNFNVIQADLFNLPFKKNTFDKVFCFGVLQHTPKPSEGIVSLSKVLKIKGKICVDIYWKRFRSLLHVKYLLRPFTKRMNKEKLLTLIHSPYITEKATSIGSLNQVVFKVDLSASKSEIKKAVEDLFDVQVESVTTSTQKGKTKRNRFGIYKRSDYKKAFISLKEGSEIQFEGIS